MALENPQTPEQKKADMAAKKAERDAKKAAKAASQPMKIEVVEEEKSESIAAASVVAEKPKAVKRVTAPTVAFVDDFVAPEEEGDLALWTFRGVSYYRSAKNAMYDAEQNFLGVFDPKTVKINADVTNPDDE